MSPALLLRLSEARRRPSSTGGVAPGKKVQGTILGSGPDQILSVSGVALDDNKDGQLGGNDMSEVSFAKPKGKKDCD